MILQSLNALRKNGITAVIRRSNGKRIIELHRTESADSESSPEIDPIDPATVAPPAKTARMGSGVRIPPFREGKQSACPTLSDLAPPETGVFRAEARAHFEIGGAV